MIFVSLKKEKKKQQQQQQQLKYLVATLKKKPKDSCIIARYQQIKNIYISILLKAANKNGKQITLRDWNH